MHNKLYYCKSAIRSLLASVLLFTLVFSPMINVKASYKTLYTTDKGGVFSSVKAGDVIYYSVYKSGVFEYNIYTKKKRKLISKKMDYAAIYKYYDSLYITANVSTSDLDVESEYDIYCYNLTSHSMVKKLKNVKYFTMIDSKMMYTRFNGSQFVLYRCDQDGSNEKVLANPFNYYSLERHGDLLYYNAYDDDYYAEWSDSEYFDYDEYLKCYSIDVNGNIVSFTYNSWLDRVSTFSYHPEMNVNVQIDLKGNYSVTSGKIKRRYCSAYKSKKKKVGIAVINNKGKKRFLVTHKAKKKGYKYSMDIENAYKDYVVYHLRRTKKNKVKDTFYLLNVKNKKKTKLGSYSYR